MGRGPARLVLMPLYPARHLEPSLLATEYEDLLSEMLEERKAKLEQLEKQAGTEKASQELRAELRFIEVELDRYRNGLSLFRRKAVPKVGRWGKPEDAEEPTKR